MKRRSQLYSQRFFTARETQVLAWLPYRTSNKELSVQLGIRPNTIENYISRILKKTKRRTRTELIWLVFSGQWRNYYYEVLPDEKAYPDNIACFAVGGCNWRCRAGVCRRDRRQRRSRPELLAQGSSVVWHADADADRDGHRNTGALARANGNDHPFTGAVANGYRNAYRDTHRDADADAFADVELAVANAAG